MSEYYKILNWDTQFFDFNVVEIKKDVLSNFNVNEVLDDLASGQVKLGYYSSSNIITDVKSDVYEIKFIIKRIPLEKKVLIHSPFHKNIELYKEDYVDEALIRLAQLAGRQGRFGNDTNISDTLCDEIFKNWMINSANKKMASHILVYKVANKIVGLATIDIREGKGYTPLFAVDRKFEGMGISFALMRAVETILKVEGCPIAVGGTQELNQKALRVYQRYGLIPQEPEYVYHLWKKK
jgi:hypothetical protein